jgi:peroxiredoxin
MATMTKTPPKAKDGRKKWMKPGSKFPDFELPDENGVMHRLSDLQGDDAMVLFIGRGEHCPRERQHQRAMVEFASWAPVAFTQMVTILPNSQHDAYRMKIAAGAPWTFLSDEDLEVQKTLDVLEYTDDHHAANVPHTVLLRPGELIVDKVYVGYWFWGRPSPYRLWDDLGDMFARTKRDFDPLIAELRPR